jgi:hypothetical protein
VEVKGSTQTDGTVRATEVKFEVNDDENDDDDRDEDRNKVELEGLVTAGGCSSFTVKNVIVTTNATTVFKNGRCAEIAVGARVHVKATRLGAATVLAMLVNIQRDADDNGKSGDRDDDDDDDDGDNRSGDRGGDKGKGKD